MSSPLRLRIYRLTNFRAKFKIEPVLAGDFEFRGKIREPVNPESQRAGIGGDPEFYFYYVGWGISCTLFKRAKKFAKMQVNCKNRM